MAESIIAALCYDRNHKGQRTGYTQMLLDQSHVSGTSLNNYILVNTIPNCQENNNNF